MSTRLPTSSATTSTSRPVAASNGGGAATLSAIASRRLQSELREWTTSPPEGCLLAGEPASLNVWEIIMTPPDCARIYENEVFRLRFRFDHNYPLEPPEVIFLSPVPVHPHIYSNGHICLSVLSSGNGGDYSPALTTSSLTISIRSMLASCTTKERPPGDKEYCLRSRGRSPKDVRWDFHDSTV